MIELVSYWKATCSPTIIVKPGILNNYQIEWWKHIYYHGLGEFFYLNGINISSTEFLSFTTFNDKPFKPVVLRGTKGVIVPVGGGKDSAVTLHLSLDMGDMTVPFLMNPRPAMTDSLEAEGDRFRSPVIVERIIDPLLLELNSRGYLNGHTPFSALLAFYTLLAGYITGITSIRLSNESSANEPTIPGTSINHQYSKSFDFERRFRDYTGKIISPDFNYHSFLRPLNELQIAALFSGFKQFHAVFRSCNVGSKTNIWCGKCSKCLFTTIILAPYLPAETVRNIFNKDLFDDPELIPMIRELSGMDDIKPFECVGTINEVRLALSEIIRKFNGRQLPVLLKVFRESDYYIPDVKHIFRNEIKPENKIRHDFLDANEYNFLADKLKDAQNNYK